MPEVPRSLMPILVGEANPYGGDPDMALVPFPDGCSGHRLCYLVLGMTRKSYMDSFLRVNLCEERWILSEAKRKANKLLDGELLEGHDEETPLILLGKKVCDAFELPFAPFQQFGEDILVLPHPSGLSRSWNTPGNFLRARQAVAVMCPHLAPLMRVE